MKSLYNSLYLKEYRRELRRRETYAERILWSYLRGRRLCGYKFFRQYSIGPFIADFYCTKARLVIELDGRHHYERRVAEYDAARTEYLNSLRIRVIRFDNQEVYRNPDAVLATILIALEESNSPRPPLF